MSLSPIPKVLSTMRAHGVEALLMGGQACVLYGAAEFSRDADFAILASPENLGRLTGALAELQAEVIAVPPFEVHYLERGHAIHFRCKHPEAQGMRVDVMAHLRGVDPFPQLWARRTTWDLSEGFQVDSLALPDLVASKKTQRDKDWPMIRRLIEVSYDEGFSAPTPEQVAFWLRELRTPELLEECVRRFPHEARDVAQLRGAVAAALTDDADRIRDELAEEESRERNLDRQYWTR
ncbi:MAG TPA: hypothetical protein VGC13_10510 [Longimicrobium sp.]|uniref:hypothetical protein n=1 Tax=Longimicrobium sp. TaxID=2029185 RepID=UPI002ED91377